MERIEQRASFGGQQEVWRHRSESLACDMNFAIYLPPAIERGPCPVLYFLSGLTCSEQNFISKAGAQRYAAEHGVIIVAPDTSPRGDEVADDPAYDLGKGAGFYLSATQQPWAAHYQMYDYIVHELPALIESTFPATDRRAITGHSMGGHGALTIALRNPGRYRSVSAFSPICAPTEVPWGKKAFSAYLGPDESTWAAWDTVALLEQAEERLPFLVDQGLADDFLPTQLGTPRLREMCERVGHPLTLRMHEGYDHSYYFIASFIGEHVAHHVKAMRG
ncbi:MAG: S-formylglutathione hydrolase [Bradymonadia bacterium]|jgi:S-formylglutathione hydrolase